MNALRCMRSNAPLMAIKAAIVAMLLMTVYLTSAFSYSASAAIDRSFSDEQDLDLYAIADTLTDPGAFENYRKSRAGLESVARFYNELNQHRSLRLLSVFDQPMPVTGFRGADQFQYGHGTDMGARGPYPDPLTGEQVVDVKSFQLNRRSFEHYGLRVAEGPGIDWDAVDYRTGRIPVLLGSEYRGVYAVGDRLEASYYFSLPVTFEVAGFLEPDSTIFYKGEMNTYLDQHLLVPYPPTIGQIADGKQEFAGILYFAMINSDLAAPRTMAADAVLREVGAIAQRTGFTDYTFLNVPSYLVQFHLMRDLIQGNAELLRWLELLLTAAIIVLAAALTHATVARSARQLTIRWEIGEPLPVIARTAGSILAVEYGLAAICVGAAIGAVPFTNFESAGPVLLAWGCLLGLDALFQRTRVCRALAIPWKTGLDRSA